MNKEISIVMSTYNESKKELKESIESMLAQTFSDFEFIIVLDNPKNEEHIKILKEYEKYDSRIKIIINEKNVGLAESLNRGIMASNSKYIARMDADDISCPDRLEKEYNFLEKNEDIDIVSTNKIDINENNNVINIGYKLPTEDYKIRKLLEIGSVICHSAAMFRRKEIVDIGCYRLFPASQDYDLWLRASYANLKFSIIDEKLIKYRVRENNISNSNPLKQYLLKEYIQKLYKERKKKGHDSFSTLNLNKYLEKNNAFNDDEINKFKKAIVYMNNLKKSINKKNFFKVFDITFKLLFIQKKSKKLLFSSIKSHIMKVVI